MYAMPLHQPRHDAYGNPVPSLTEARVERLYDRPMNQDVRRTILQELERHYDTLLRRGTYAEVTVSFVVKNGILAEDVRVGVVEIVRVERGE
jgi:hypothetical protein